MKLSISNIGWSAEMDRGVYLLMQRYGYTGLEIAPTRVLPDAPYDHAKEARRWSQDLKRRYGSVISSMQSIWYGCREQLFGTERERDALLAYTKKAVRFAEVIGCGHLVFGCPRNRSLSEGADLQTGIRFFREIGDYAAGHGTVIGMEAVPQIYGTDYINDTKAALGLIRRVGSKGFLLNLDVGAMVQNGEDVSVLKDSVHLVHHVHISEPGLGPIQERRLHMDLRDVLMAGGYEGFISIEMGKVEDIDVLDSVMEYVRRVFG